MRAACYERTGPAAEVLRLVELPMPTPGPGEVRVRVHASGVNPVDVKTRNGSRGAQLPFPQMIPHSDGAGVIEATGPGVPAHRLGERVWLWNCAWGRPQGTAAEYVVVPSAQAVPLPHATSFAEGACLGIPALTAWHAVHVDGGVAGKRVLVAGGAGAVGHYAIQFAKAAGARQVLASVSSPHKAHVALAAGADLAIDYRQENLVERVLDATEGEGVERVVEVDGQANREANPAITCPEAEIVVYGSGASDVAVPFRPSILKNLRYRFFIVFNLNAEDRARALAGLTRRLAAGCVQHHLGAHFTLDEIAAAQEAVERAAIGNVVIELA